MAETGDSLTRRRRYLRRAARVALGLLGILVALGVVAGVGARLYLNGPRSRSLAVSILDRTLAGRFHLDGFTWERFPSAVVLEGVAVDAPDGTRVLTAARVAARIDLVALLGQQVHLTRVAVTDLGLRADAGPTGLGLAAAFGSKGGPSRAPARRPPGRGWAVVVDTADVTGIDYAMHAPDYTVVVAGGAVHRASLVLALPRVENDLGLVTADAVDVTYKGRPLHATALRVEDGRYRRTGKPAEARFAMRSASAAFGRSRASVHGEVSGLTRGIPWKLDLAAKADVDLASPQLRAFVPEAVIRRLDPSGRLSITGTLGGTMAAPRIRATVAGTGLEVAGRALQRLALAGTLDDRTVTVDRLDLEAGGGSLGLTGRLGLGGRRAPWRLRATLGRLPLRRLASAVVDPKWLPRWVSGRLELRGTGLADPRGRVSAHLKSVGRPEALPAAVPDALDLDAEAAFTRAAAHLSRLHVEGDGVDLDATGSVPFGRRGALYLTASLDDPRPEALTRLLGLPLRVTRSRLIATASGTVGAPVVQGSLTVDGLRGARVPVFDLSAPFRLEGGSLYLTHALATGAGGQVSVDGQLAVLAPARAPGTSPAVDARVHVDGLALAGFTRRRVTGRAWADLAVQGTVAAPVGGGRARVEGLAVGGEAFTRASATLALDGRTVAVKDLALVSRNAGRLEGSATLSLARRRLVAHVTGTALALSHVLAAAGATTPIAGVGKVEAWATGEVTDPLIQAAVQVKGLSVRDTPLGELTAWIRGTLTSLQVNATVDGPPGHLDVDGVYGVRDQTMDLHVAGTRLALGALPGLAPKAAKALPSVDGRAAVDLHLVGGLPLPAAEGQVSVAALSLRGRPVPGGTATFTLSPEPEGAGVHVVASALGAVTATADLRPGPPLTVTATATLEGLEVARLLPSLGEFHAQVVTSGTASFRWRQGPGGGTSASVRLTRVDATVPDGTLSASQPVVATWDGQTFTLEQLVLTGPRGRFSAQGRVGAVLQATVKGRLETALAAPFVSAIARASGPLDVDLEASGTPGRPVVRGTIDLPAPVHIRPRAGVREVSLTGGRIVLTPGQVRLEKLTGEIEAGLFTADGSVAVDGLTPGHYHLTVSGQNLPLRASDLVLEANTDLTLDGEGAKAQVTGRVDVVRGRYLRKFELKNFIFVARPTSVEEPLARRYPWLSDIVLGVQATSTGGMEVKVDAGAFATDLTLDSDLQITGTAADPVIDGRVSADHGSITFPKAKLDVVRAVVEFNPTAGEGVHPEVDLRAEGEVNPPPTGSELTQVTHYVTLTLQGNLEQMVLDLSSDPALDKLEVLSLLITGRVNPIAPGTAGSSSEADAALAFAGSQLAQPLTQFVTSQLEKTLNLQLQLGAEVTTQAITVTAGQAITRRLRLEGAYQQSLGEAQTVAVARARFLLSDRLFLEGSTESVSGTGNTTSALQEGTRSRLELKLRIFGN